MPTSSTEHQLREARLRIAILEKEVQTLRASVPSNSTLNPTKNSPPPKRSPPPSSNNAISTSSTPSFNHALAYSDISRDQSQLSASHQSSLFTTTPSSPKPLSSAPSTNVSPLINDVPKTSTLPLESPSSKFPSQLTPKPLAPAPTIPVNQSTSSPRSLRHHTTPKVTLPAQGNVPRRRVSPLPIAKTSSTRKERPTNAKGVEQRTGQTRYWTPEEHERFLEAIAEYGEKAYVAISKYVETRTPKQVRTHAQKFQMKMARRARQSLEAGQPIQMPLGMRPVIEVPIGSKPTIVPITPEQSAKLSAKSGGAPLDPKTIVSTLSSTRQNVKKRGVISRCEGQGDESDNLKSASIDSQKATEGDFDDTKGSEIFPTAERDRSSLSQLEKDSMACSSPLTDEECVDFMECEGGATKDEMELETSLEVKLNQSLGDGSSPEADGGSTHDLLVSEQSTNGSSSRIADDDLEDLEELEDGDLSLAPFVCATENWLLPGDDAPSTEI